MNGKHIRVATVITTHRSRLINYVSKEYSPPTFFQFSSDLIGQKMAFYLIAPQLICLDFFKFLRKKNLSLKITLYQLKFVRGERIQN